MNTKTLQQHLDEEEERIRKAFERAEREIERQGITDRYMLGKMEGKNMGGKNNPKFVVNNQDKIWELIEMGYTTDEITEYIYKNKGK